MRSHAYTLVAIAVCLVLIPLAPAKAVTIRLPYDSPAILGYQGPQDCDADATHGAGTVCLDIPNGVHSLALRAQDQTDLRVGGAWYLHDDAGGFHGAGTFCRSDLIPIPSGADLLVVRLEAVNGPVHCAGTSAGAPTRGIVTIQLG